METTRLEVLKTYKLYIGGAFPRTESGRYFKVQNKAGRHLANVCLASRKDLRNAVVAARAAQPGWSSRAAFNRSQILYRIAEMLESRKEQFIQELLQQDSSPIDAEAEVIASIERLVYYAGWCDKYQQIFSSVNPVASSHFNFSLPEAVGVVGIFAPQSNSLIGLVSAMAAVITGGNTCIILAAEDKSLCGISFGEVLHSSDVPGGVVNILTGKTPEILPWMATHMDVNAIVYCNNNNGEIAELKEKAATNLKRIVITQNTDWLSDEAQSPYTILSTQEIKTTWHPVENIAGSGGGY